MDNQQFAMRTTAATAQNERINAQVADRQGAIRRQDAANDIRAQTGYGRAGVARILWRTPLVFGLVLGAVGEPILRNTPPEAATKIVQRWVRAILRVANVEVSIIGTPPEGVGLFVANHRSYVDILAVMHCLPVAFLCKQEVASWPLIGTAASRMGAVFVNRTSRESRAATLNAVAAAALAGRKVVAFPEGTTHRSPGMGSTHPGLFKAAETHGFALFPLVIEYADPDDAWVGDDTLLRHVLWWLSKPGSRVTLSFGPAITPDPKRPALHTQQAAAEWMADELRELLSHLASAKRSTDATRR